MARIKCWRPETLFAEADVAAARTEAIKAARIVSGRLAVQRLAGTVRSAGQGAAPSPSAPAATPRRLSV